MSKRSQLSTASNEQNQSYLTDQMVDINFCCFEIFVVLENISN